VSCLYRYQVPVEGLVRDVKDDVVVNLMNGCPRDSLGRESAEREGVRHCCFESQHNCIQRFYRN
jgi:hypothetical protein